MGHPVWPRLQSELNLESFEGAASRRKFPLSSGGRYGYQGIRQYPPVPVQRYHISGSSTAKTLGSNLSGAAVWCHADSEWFCHRSLVGDQAPASLDQLFQMAAKGPLVLGSTRTANSSVVAAGSHPETLLCRHRRYGRLSLFPQSS